MQKISGLTATAVAALAVFAICTGAARADGVTAAGVAVGVAGAALLHHLSEAHYGTPQSTTYHRCYPGTQDCLRERICHYGQIGTYHCHFR